MEAVPEELEITPVAASTRASQQPTLARFLSVKRNRGLQEMMFLDHIPQVYRVVADAMVIKLHPKAIRSDEPEYHVQILNENIGKLRAAGISIPDAGIGLATAWKFGKPGKVHEFDAKFAGDVISCALRNSAEKTWRWIKYKKLQILERMYCFCTGVRKLEDAKRFEDGTVIEGAYIDQRRTFSKEDRNALRRTRTRRNKRRVLKETYLGFKRKVRDIL